MSGRNDPPATTVEVTIDRLGFQGDGIARHDDGLTVRELIVPLALPGERWLVRLTGRDGRRWRARPQRLLGGDARRNEPVCRHFGRCGGCALQHLDKSCALSLKIGMIEGALRSRRLTFPAFEPASTSPLRSRRRIRIAFDRNGRLGFRERWSRNIVPVDHCPVAHPALDRLLPPLARTVPSLDCIAGTGEILLTLADNGVDLHWLAEAHPTPGDLERLEVALAPLSVIRISRSNGRDGFDETLWQRYEPLVTFGDSCLPLPPRSFLQATAEGLASLQAFVQGSLAGCRRVCDLFSGLGSLSLPLMQKLDALCAIDANRSAIGTLSTIPGLRAVTRDLHENPLAPDEFAPFDGAIIDPPRAGAQAQAEAIAGSGIRRLVHVSCNPASFARDTAILCSAGFRIERLLPVDQFTHASSIELAAYLTRR
ncbi:MAG: hypothetical protein R3C70_15295 [Geminicoccaceae bacterium]